MDYNNVVILLLGLVLVGVLGFFGYKIKKNNPSMRIGDIINAMVTNDAVTIFVFALIAFVSGEALMAASVKSEQEVNAMARILTHGSVGFLSFVCGLLGVGVLKQSVQTKSPWKFSYGLLLLFGMFMFPYLNLIVIAGGLKELHLLVGLFNSGLITSRGMRFFAQMSYPLQASVVMTFAHYFLIIIDAFHTHVSERMASVIDTLGSSNQGENKKDKKKKKGDEAVEKNAEKAQERALKNFDDGIAFLLSGKYNLKKQAAAKIQRSKEIKDAMPEADRVILSGKVFKLVQDIKSWTEIGAKSATEEQRKTKNSEFKKKIYDLWKAPTSGGQGFGFQLPHNKKDFDPGN